MEEANSQNATAEQVQSGLNGLTAEGSGEHGKGEVVNWEKRYSDSSAEGRRNYERAVKAEAELQALKSGSSLTTQNDKSGRLPDEETYVQWWTANGEKSEKEARAEYKREYSQEVKFQAMEESNRALMRRLQFEEEQREKVVSTSNPLAQEANEFFKDIPEVNSLSLTDKIERYKVFQNKGIVKSSGRDLSQIKSAAGSTVGGSGSKSQESPHAAFDEQAKLAGFKSYQAQQELNKVGSAAEYAAWKAKYKK